ncbi:hypothetical protein ZEAMMB73_Zm00001d010367 [Zea mays]|uniref:Uncharacterized protein n=1 Tax=Zea mays TaxID=4577 RepID=A0A1D6FQP3_MAIZE|nr:hypothetical protein ZEAMMB73_Zm00001d010367 [Zea mays]
MSSPAHISDASSLTGPRRVRPLVLTRLLPMVLVALFLKWRPFLILDYENYYPKGKKEVPKGDCTNKSESKQESNTDEGWNFQDNAMKQMQNFLAPLLIQCHLAPQTRRR